MSIGWQAGLLVFLKTFSEILTAGIAITAFSLLLYALSLNLRDRVVRSFVAILFFTGIVFTAEAIGSIESSAIWLNFWLRLQWVGIVFLPAAYLHFSDALLATTGRPSRGRRRWAIRFTYLISIIFISGLPFSYFVGPVVFTGLPLPHLQANRLTNLFLVFYGVVLVVSWINFLRAYRRTTTTPTRRRMVYLITSALAPVLGAFPFLPYSPDFSARHQALFWGSSLIVNVMVGVLLVIMAYSVAFFGVSWPDREVKIRLFKWIMRGPFTASVTLALATLTRRTGEAFGTTYSALVPIVTVGSILLIEYLITMLAPFAIRWLFYGKDKTEMGMLHTLEEQLLTRNDLNQFFEMVLATASDRLQSQGAYVAALNPDGLELVVSTGKTLFSTGGVEDFSNLSQQVELTDSLIRMVSEPDTKHEVFRWGDDYLFPLLNGTPESPELIGLFGVSGVSQQNLDEEQNEAMSILTQRAALALKNRRIQESIFLSLETLSPGMNLIQKLRAAGQYDRGSLLAKEEDLPDEDNLASWVKDALTHYWGGPKLTENPLLQLKIVQDALTEHDGNQANALRSILRKAIDQIRPEGERRFTGEWILYNILELKFLEGKKVREVALRLAMSEADLYRKQRVAIEVVAKAIGEMEVQARKEPGI